MVLKVNDSLLAACEAFSDQQIKLVHVQTTNKIIDIIQKKAVLQAQQ